ncbi:MAG: FISUMP domain-containing protein [Flavobacteriales bacterium]
MHHLRTLIAAACLASVYSAQAQSVLCSGEPLVFEVDGDHYGTKSWEYSADGVTWNTVDVVENEPFILQPQQSGWYRVRFYDEVCDVNYFSDPQRFVTHTIDLGSALTISIGGVVRNEHGAPVPGATVRAGCGIGVSTITDQFGVYHLEGVTAREGMATVTVEKEGYFTGTRSFVPAESAVDATSHAYITLLKKLFSGTVWGSTGGTVSQGDLTITFPANAFTQNGTPYNGPVYVYLNQIDPTSADLRDRMPGMLVGVQNDQPQLLYSYGMVGVELVGAADNTVQLTPATSATLRFPVVAAQQAAAPTSIPLWSFDEDLGYWVEDGVAERVGNYYEGQVAHFSWWNIDVPSDFVQLGGSVIDQASGGALSNAEIRLISTSMGTGTTYTNGSGEFVGLVPINEVLDLEVWLPCGPLGEWILVHQEEVGPLGVETAIVVSVEGLQLKLVVGNVVGCSEEPIDGAYVWVNGQAVFCSDGAFEFRTCLDTILLRSVDPLAGNVGDVVSLDLDADTTNAGQLVTCTPMFGTVTDFDGNVYPTVTIGLQDWMATSLRTSHLRDGIAIPNVTGSAAWGQLTSGAWCNYGNNVANDTIYGKLYNWFAASDPNICPQGWHVPSATEWTILAQFLGGHAGAGAELKAVSPLWNGSNAGATNASGFSGLPGGIRAQEGSFNFLGNYGHFWSASESGADAALYRSLDYFSTFFGGVDSPKKEGQCVRCVRD